MATKEKFTMTYDPSIREDIPFPKPEVLENLGKIIKTPEFKKHFGINSKKNKNF